MKRNLRAFRVVAVLAVLTSSVAYAATAKNSIQLTDISVLPKFTATGNGSSPWVTILNSQVHMSSQKDLVATVSLQTGLYTDTLVRSKGGDSDTSSAEAGIEVRVLVDGVEAEPGVVVFDRRKQTLMAKFGGILQECTDSNGDGTIVGATECTWDDEELQLILETMGAHAFVFALNDVGVGAHDVEVQARILVQSASQSGTASAYATIGKGTMSLEEVRLVQASDITSY